jgi:hypothetical protein
MSVILISAEVMWQVLHQHQHHYQSTNNPAGHFSAFRSLDLLAGVGKCDDHRQRPHPREINRCALPAALSSYIIE